MWWGGVVDKPILIITIHSVELSCIELRSIYLFVEVEARVMETSKLTKVAERQWENFFKKLNKAPQTCY